MLVKYTVPKLRKLKYGSGIASAGSRLILEFRGLEYRVILHTQYLSSPNASTTQLSQFQDPDLYLSSVNLGSKSTILDFYQLNVVYCHTKVNLMV